MASSDPAYTLPSRGTIVAHIEELYETEKQSKINLLQNANAVSLTGDHWTSVSNQNYLGVTAHHIDADWKLHPVALTVKHCAEQFSEVAEQWDIAGKGTTIGTDSARNMTAAARLLPYEHMPCVAHSLQRSITAVFRMSWQSAASCLDILSTVHQMQLNCEHNKMSWDSHRSPSSKMFPPGGTPLSV